MCTAAGKELAGGARTGTTKTNDEKETGKMVQRPSGVTFIAYTFKSEDKIWGREDESESALPLSFQDEL